MGVARELGRPQAESVLHRDRERLIVDADEQEPRLRRRLAPVGGDRDGERCLAPIHRLDVGGDRLERPHPGRPVPQHPRLVGRIFGVDAVGTYRRSAAFDVADLDLVDPVEIELHGGHVVRRRVNVAEVNLHAPSAVTVEAAGGEREVVGRARIVVGAGERRRPHLRRAIAHLRGELRLRLVAQQ